MYLVRFGIGNGFLQQPFRGRYVLRDCFFMLLPCHLGACLAVAPAAAAAGCLRLHATGPRFFVLVQVGWGGGGSLLS